MCQVLPDALFASSLLNRLHSLSGIARMAADVGWIHEAIHLLLWRDGAVLACAVWSGDEMADGRCAPNPSYDAEQSAVSMPQKGIWQSKRVT